jgi:hypothetical protein
MAFRKTQKRDRRGRWTSGGGSAAKSSSKTKRNQRNTRRKLAVGSVGIGAGIGYLALGPVGALAGAGIVGANNLRLARKLKKRRG